MIDRIPILLDTDIGTDIDDALALAYLLRQPRCELLGVTIVTGNVEERAAIADVVCRAYGRHDVPIRLGASDPLGNGQGQPDVPHYEAVRHLPHRRDHPGRAVDFLRETIRARPHEIVLLSIGPLTNMAILFALDPEIPHLLKGMVSMAGSFFRDDHGEWNCVCDPEATVATIRRSVNHTLVGLDVTLQCTMPPADVRQHFSHPPADVLLLMAEKFLQHADRVTFHDPLAAALIFQPALCTTRSVNLSVDAKGNTLVGDKGWPHVAADTVDHAGFFKEYFSILDGQSVTP